MSDLISRSKLMDVFRTRMVERYDREKCASDENCKVCKPGCFWRIAIPAAPAVDAVPREKYDKLKDNYNRLLKNAGYMVEALKQYEEAEVVRCKECKFLGFKDFSGICRGMKVYGVVKPNDYCSWGERKDEC